VLCSLASRPQCFNPLLLVCSELHHWQLELARLPADVFQALLALRDTCAQVRDALLEFDAAVEPAAAFASVWGDECKRTAHKAAAQLEYDKRR
jgi:hypothetical protein